MPWLKKNLLLVIGGGIALILLILAGFFLFTKIRRESEVSGTLATQTEQLTTLANQNPHPGNEKTDNIKAARQQEKDLQDYLLEAKKTFVPLNYPTNLDGGRFTLLLDNTVDELRRAAERSSVKMQKDYAFTFAAQKQLLSFEAKTIEPLTRMLMDIREVCLILFQAKVLTLDGIRRVAVTTQDTPGASPGSSDYWTRKPTTNDFAILTPYEFTFHCFTPELAEVLSGLYRSPHCFIVKSIIVDPTPSTLLEPGEGAETTMPMMMGGMGMDRMRLMMRYGMMGRYAMPPPPAETTPQTAAQATRGGLKPVLDEKPFRVVMWVDALRLTEGKPERPAKRPRPAVGPDGAPVEAAPGEAAPADASANAAAPTAAE